MSIELVRTCDACPEQYDAFLNGQQVGYLRLRWGGFSVRCPNASGAEVFFAPVGDSMQGIFEPDERELYLEQAKRAIAKWLRVAPAPVKETRDGD